jgi:hypothetical protein
MIEVKNDIDSLRSLSQIFTPSNFKRIVKRKDYSYTINRISKHVTFQTPANRKNLIESVYKELQTNYKSEYLYKNALVNKLLLGKYSLNTTTIINEFKIGGSIADFVLLNGEARIFEIKTELDSLDKLSKQVFDYCQFANKVYVVTASKFIDKLASEYKDSNIGIIEYTQQYTLREVVEAKDNSKYFDHLTIFKTLRKQEYLDIVNQYFGYLPKVPNTKIFKECVSLVKLIEVKEFQRLAFQKLKERKLRCPDLLKSDKTPYELKHICYSLDMNEREYSELFDFLNQTI